MGVTPIDPPPGGDTESAAYAGTMQTMENAGGGEQAPPGAVARAFGYNAANRMSGTSLGGEHLMSYRHNGRGERVYRQGSDRTVHTVFDEADRWIGDYDENGAVIQQAIWLGDLPVGLLAKDGGITRLFHIEADALGSPRAVIDPTRGARGAVVWRWDLAGEAFGNDKPNEDPDGDGIAFVFDMRFPGQQYDSATGLNYNYFRDYDPATGRYVQSDPIGLLGGINTFSYANLNPLNMTDRMGLSSECPAGECAPGKQRFDSAHQAARQIFRYTGPVSMRHNLEVCGNVCVDSNGKYFWTGTIVGLIDRCNPTGTGVAGKVDCPSCSTRVAAWHTHPDAYDPDSWWPRFLGPTYDSENFSGADKNYARDNRINVYLLTPQGSFQTYLWQTGTIQSGGRL